jgi:hypothetical protein
VSLLELAHFASQFVIAYDHQSLIDMLQNYSLDLDFFGTRSGKNDKNMILSVVVLPLPPVTTLLVLFKKCFQHHQALFSRDG